VLGETNPRKGVPMQRGAVEGPEVAADVEPAFHETRDRVITAVITIGPFLALGFGCWQAWQGILHASDLIVFAILYLSTALGITVGFHRLFTHRSFKTSAPMRALFAILGSAAIEGPMISWVADHRKHHAFSDRPGDPHSPHVDHGVGWIGALRGLLHAHLGWIFIHTHRGLKSRYAPDLQRDRVARFVDRTFLVWALAGFGVAFGLGVAIGGTVVAGLTALLWGGAVRMFFVHHITYSINSLCHFFGRRAFETRDESRNLAWLAPLSLGEAWHNNHHAFPTSAVHGLGRWQLDPSAMVIAALEKLGLVWDVVRPSPERQLQKAIAG
jgi:stearoyl-CoA desaturase (Delta-9 desaturase)